MAAWDPGHPSGWCWAGPGAGGSPRCHPVLSTHGRCSRCAAHARRAQCGGGTMGIPRCPPWLGGHSNLPPAPQNPLLQCSAGSRLFWGLWCPCSPAPSPRFLGTSPPGQGRARLPQSCCQLGFSPSHARLSGPPGTHGTTGAAGTWISPRESSGVFADHHTHRHPNGQACGSLGCLPSLRGASVPVTGLRASPGFATHHPAGEGAPRTLGSPLGPGVPLAAPGWARNVGCPSSPAAWGCCGELGCGAGAASEPRLSRGMWDQPREHRAWAPQEGTGGSLP